jgi:hypothetical protein
MDHIVLSHGAHETRGHGVCLLEAVAWFANEKHSDAPECACPVIAAFGRRLNDRLDDEQRQRLKELIPALALSRASWPVTLKRAFMAADFAVREAAPRALEAHGFKKAAQRLRALPEIVDRATARMSSRAADAAAYADAAADAAAAAAAYADIAADTDAADADAAAAYADIAADAAADAADAYTAAEKQLADDGIALIERMLAVKE